VLVLYYTPTQGRGVDNVHTRYDLPQGFQVQCVSQPPGASFDGGVFVGQAPVTLAQPVSCLRELSAVSKAFAD